DGSTGAATRGDVSTTAVRDGLRFVTAPCTRCVATFGAPAGSSPAATGPEADGFDVLGFAACGSTRTDRRRRSFTVVAFAGTELGLSPLRTGVPEMEDWLRRLTDNMFPPPNASINLALAMERIGEVLEVFSTAFVEMRDAHGRFCDEMSLERPTADSILQTTK